MIKNLEKKNEMDKKFQIFLKRLFDIVFSIIGIVVFLPMYIIVSIFIKIDSKGPILFKQKRFGMNKKVFYIYKFRTMIVDSESKGKLITIGNDSRITNIGKIIRKYKIDETPQLINVLKGEMSFVGSRPEVEKYINYYKEDFDEVLRLRPGITDLASIEYRNENDILSNVNNPEEYYINVIMKEKLALNKKYIENFNLIYDIKIIIKTILKCFK